MRLLDVQRFAELTDEERSFLASDEMPIPPEELSGYVVYVVDEDGATIRLLAPQTGAVAVGQDIARSEDGTYHRSLSLMDFDAPGPFKVLFEVHNVAPVAATHAVRG